jgi:AcrR family transcriptional regulator
MSDEIAKTTPSRPRRRRPSEVRALILTAADRVFSRKGYAGTTLDEVAEEAGVSGSVMYRNFRTKSELFSEAVLVPFVDFLAQLTTEAPSRAGSPHWGNERLMHEYVGDLYENLHDHRDALVGLVAAGSNLDPEASRRITLLLEQVVGALTEVHEEEARHRAGVSPVDADLTHRAVLSMISGLIAFGPWFLPHGRQRVSRERLVGHLSKLLLYGLNLAPPGDDVPPPEG